MEFKVRQIQKITKTDTDDTDIYYSVKMEATSGYDKLTVKFYDDCPVKIGERYELKLSSEQ